MKRMPMVVALAGVLIGIASAPPSRAQVVVKQIMVQDSTLNNLVDPPGYRTAALGTLGGVTRAGTGSQPMILVPGLGFGGGVFREFMERFGDSHRMYAVTLPGFGGTPAPPCPPEGTSFGEQTWTEGALRAIEALIEKENIRNPIVVGHWLTGTQIALRLARRHPTSIKAVVLLAGSAKMVLDDPRAAEYYGTPERRVASIDGFLAPRWFKTVTRETWDDNNFQPGDYAIHPVLGLRLWRQAASPDLHVWVRYLCEFNAQDVTTEMDKIAVPTLLLQPGLEGLWHDPGSNYMRNYCHTSWKGSVEKNPKLIVKTIPESRICLWLDQPEAVHEAITGFLKQVNGSSAK